MPIKKGTKTAIEDVAAAPSAAKGSIHSASVVAETPAVPAQTEEEEFRALTLNEIGKDGDTKIVKKSDVVRKVREFLGEHEITRKLQKNNHGLVEIRLQLILDSPEVEAVAEKVVASKKLGQQWKKYLTMSYVRAAAHTVPGTRQTFSYDMIGELFGGGGSTLKNNSDKKHALNEFNGTISSIWANYAFECATADASDVLTKLHDINGDTMGKEDERVSYVYVLVAAPSPTHSATDPMDLVPLVFYVGKGKNGRDTSHDKAAHKGTAQRYVRIRHLKERGYYTARVFDKISDQDALLIEGLLIRAVGRVHNSKPYYDEKRETTDDDCDFLTNGTRGMTFPALADGAAFEALMDSVLLTAMTSLNLYMGQEDRVLKQAF